MFLFKIKIEKPKISSHTKQIVQHQQIYWNQQKTRHNFTKSFLFNTLIGEDDREMNIDTTNTYIPSLI